MAITTVTLDPGSTVVSTDNLPIKVTSVAVNTGPQGPAGVNGSDGLQGIQGEKGDKGDPGSVGPAGPQGVQGIQGNQGIQGVQGDTGAGVPTGGLTGELLVKASNADYDYAWSVQVPSLAWGALTGTLSDQSDLQTELDTLQTNITGRVDKTGDIMTGNLEIDPTDDSIPIMALKASNLAQTCQYQFYIQSVMRGQIQVTSGNIQLMKRDAVGDITGQVMVSDSEINLRLVDNTDRYTFTTTGLTLPADATSNLQATTKQQVDTALGLKSDSTHNHDLDYAPLVHNHDADYVGLGGDTMTGLLVLSGDASANLGAVTKQQMDTAVATKQPIGALVGANNQTGTTYTLVAADAGKLVECNNAGAITLTVPDAVFAANDIVQVLQQGAGTVTIAAGAGTTMRKGASFTATTLEQYSIVTIYFRSASEFVLGGTLGVA